MNTKLKRERRHRRVRSLISGTAATPRISVYRSNANTFVQAIDDVSRKTITSLSTITLKKGTKSEKAMEVGKTISAELQKAGIEKAVFDRGGYKYHGRVQKVAEGLREAGLKI